MGEFQHMDLLVSDFRELVMAGDPIFDPSNWEIEVFTDPRHQVARQVDDFLNRIMEVSKTTALFVDGY